LYKSLKHALDIDTISSQLSEEEKVVAKSKSIDPDGISHSTTEETLLERTGRKSNGMTW